MTEEFNESMINDIKEGDKVTAKVQQVEDKQVVVHIDGAKYNGIIPISQLSTHHIENPSEIISEGDEIEAYVTKIEIDEENESGAYILSKRQLETEKSYEYLQEKLDNDEVIEAKVTEVVKGGLVVDVGQRGFVPASLISTDFIEDFSVFEGQTIRLKVEELDPENNRVILSRKAVEQAENDVKKASLLDSLNEGDVIKGKVARLTNFGAFVDIGGVDGLVHVSELSHEHVQSPEDVVSVGQEVDVKVKSVEKDSERISLSIKDTLPTPFENIKGKFHENDVIEGKVIRLANFGAFVEIAPGVQGLVHISEIAHKHIGTPSEVLEPGQQVSVKILGIDEENERISLSIKATLPNEDVIESDEATTQSYLSNETDEDNPTLGDVFGDKFKNLKF
ncbi:MULTISPECIES: 30S ribosomal protein S1 [Staphylococcus]|uniref:Small ribosomal subunit protein bS1 n=4 Tax=Staphylococcus TaxID=1279 RepID=A0A4Q9WT99_STAHO|nr:MULTISPECIES: 30S ribosomal protein S1 [Staphylococcus]MBF9295010.1 30S ribosomal protein S1 [Staphylococcus epidermidis]OFK82240.1 30S ribosomal protein S1 [Staphylococcus sp. HMSC057A02]OFM56875.1 30S ribosomal protein S1 [Staphylococcus sp. HMSC059G05]OFM63969.1 30S ribosomal protein S1 [Staphylococcus sp. HMSC062C01]OFM66852.1 30S ribosomal protein S1 [Staphylococcus sp. HMSC068D07]OFM76886.1 30S ribosomal protein S1 [Staphylococcus sp. HMSC074B09]OFM91062.1 30S ribosomal protein S1 [